MSDLLRIIKSRCKEVADCWVWTQCTNNAGHPQISIAGHPPRLVRRLAFIEAGGVLDSKSHVVVSVCDDIRCCNPAHLKRITRSQLLKLSYAEGRRDLTREVEARRDQAICQGWAKLDREKAAEIKDLIDKRSAMSISERKKIGLTSRAIAERFGVSTSTIDAIAQGLMWRSVPSPANSVFSWRPAA